MSARKTFTYFVVALPLLTGCDSGGTAKLQEDERNFHEVLKNQTDSLQWQLDEATARRLFDDTQSGLTRYTTFLKCHEAPPTHDANKQACAALQARVVKREANDAEQARRAKAAW